MRTAPSPRSLFGAAALFAAAVLAIQCNTAENSAAARRSSSASPEALAAWATVYGVLQHPRCVNCHPAGDAPLQGDESQPHAQNVLRGPDGHGLFALRCENCHRDENTPGPKMPPGAPHWMLPHPDMPLVFEGRSSGELCRQFLDRARNGGRTPEQIFEHVAYDPLVLWGWNPGEGRAPVSTPHAELVRAIRTWIDEGCGCPD